MARRATSLTKKPKAAEAPEVPEQKAAPAPRRGKKSKPQDMPPAEMSVADAFFPGGDEAPAEAEAAPPPPAKARRSRKPKPAPEPVAPEPAAPEPAAMDDSHAHDGDAHAEAPASVSVPEEAAPASAAARWDAGTGAATFDWPAIEQVAAAEGPNQAMAKLLLAARAEGANSRWPF